MVKFFKSRFESVMPAWSKWSFRASLMRSSESGLVPCCGLKPKKMETPFFASDLTLGIVCLLKSSTISTGQRPLPPQHNKNTANPMKETLWSPRNLYLLQHSSREIEFNFFEAFGIENRHLSFLVQPPKPIHSTFPISVGKIHSSWHLL